MNPILGTTSPRQRTLDMLGWEPPVAPAECAKYNVLTAALAVVAIVATLTITVEGVRQKDDALMKIGLTGLVGASVTFGGSAFLAVKYGLQSLVQEAEHNDPTVVSNESFPEQMEPATTAANG